MKRQRLSLSVFLGVQLFVVSASVLAYFRLSDEAEVEFQETVLGQEVYREIPIDREKPLWVPPLYDDPSVVSDEDLAKVLRAIRPLFPEKERKPNFVEHALRAWGVNARFQDPRVMSGEEMRDFLLDHSRYAASWGADDSHEVDPLLIDRPRGLAVNWGSNQDTSVHHDHMLASLTEAGIHRDQRVYPPSGRSLTVNDMLQEALRDFRPDERETEWSAMAFGLWLPPVKSWRTQRGRLITFDLMAERLMRGHKEIGVCSGTHRVYSLMLLWRIDREYDILSDEINAEIFAHLEDVRDLISLSQFPDGHWPANWADGESAVTNSTPDAPHRDVIATGHHLEWLAIAPQELHPPREMIRKAARWLIDNTTSQTPEALYDDYTFYSHVGNALALWRKTHPAVFWQEWIQEHPDFATAPPEGEPALPPEPDSANVPLPNPE